MKGSLFFAVCLMTIISFLYDFNNTKTSKSMFDIQLFITEHNLRKNTYNKE